MREKIAKMLIASREDVGKSRKFMCDTMNITTKTLWNWENGYSYPTALQLFEWFDILNVDINLYINHYYTNDEYIATGDKEIKKELHKEIDNATPRRRQLLHYILCQQHSGDMDGFLNVMVAYLQTQWKDRIAQSALIMTNYRLNKENKKCTVEPNVTLVDRSIKKCSESYMQGTDGYRLTNKDKL